jgi:hypothetical protein
MKPLQSYHLVWLLLHPDRSEAWLRDKFSEGFDIHHLDGDHANDKPENLVLIEHADHMRLHGMTGNGRLRRVAQIGPRLSTLNTGKIAYNSRLRGQSWRQIGRVGMASAKVFAKSNGLSWPPI